MTWGEFKKQMSNAGVVDSDEIGWIDIGCEDAVDIEFNEGSDVREIQVS